MNSKISYLLLIGALFLTFPAQASSVKNGLETKLVLEKVKNDNFVNLPLKSQSEQDTADTKPLPKIKIKNEAHSPLPKIQRDLIADFNANLGIIKAEVRSQTFTRRPAALPRGRYFRPLNSKLGAEISKKF